MKKDYSHLKKGDKLWVQFGSQLINGKYIGLGWAITIFGKYLVKLDKGPDFPNIPVWYERD